MAEDTLPTDVEAFVTNVIDSVATMEALMLTYRHRDATWTVERVAERLYVEPARAEESLQRLARHGILACEADHYRCAPHEAALEELLSSVATTYQRQLIAVTNLIHSRTKSSITAFANAFRMRKDK